MSSKGILAHIWRASVRPSIVCGQQSVGIGIWRWQVTKQRCTRWITEEALLKSSNVGENDDVEKTGFIGKEQKETLLYFDRLTTIKSGSWDLRPVVMRLVTDTSDKGLRDKVRGLSQGEEAAGTYVPINITKFRPVSRDGGAFVKFRVPDTLDVVQFNRAVMRNVAAKARRGLAGMLLHPRAFPVKGVPWIEDLARYPSPKLKVEFAGPDLTQENLYALFRRYGAISDIRPPAPDSKALPRHAVVAFRNTRSAVAARQCLSGMRVGTTVLHIQYERVVKENAVVQFMSAHTRIMVPLMLALVAALTVAIFDPIRHFFITEKITGAYSLQRSGAYQRIARLFSSTKDRMSKMLSFGGGTRQDGVEWNSVAGMKDERDGAARGMRVWLGENVNSFIVVQGPRGTGKRSLVQECVLAGRDNVLYIDCEAIVKSRKESEFIRSVAGQLGYFPVFPWLTSLSMFTDLAVQGLTGQKSGLSETKETQVKSMLAFAADTMRDIALRGYSATVSSEARGRRDKEGEVEGESRSNSNSKGDAGGPNSITSLTPRTSTSTPRTSTSTSTSTSARVLKEEDYLRQNPGAKPVVVIDRFQAARNGREQYAFVYKQLAQWAASLVALDIAHVIFITDDVGSVQMLASALPGVPLKRTVLSDASAAAAQSYVVGKLVQAGKRDLAKAPELRRYTAQLGGRMLDLQMFVRRIQSGDTPRAAYEGLVRQSVEQLTQQLMRAGGGATGGPTFTQPQAWCVIQQLAAQGQVSFTEIQKHPLFKADPYRALQALESAEIIALQRDRGVIRNVRAAKPLYSAAFAQMVNNKAVYNSMQSDYLKALIAQISAKVAGLEDEVARYRGVDNSRIFRVRLDYLAHKIATFTAMISGWESELAGLRDSE